MTDVFVKKLFNMHKNKILLVFGIAHYEFDVTISKSKILDQKII